MFLLVVLRIVHGLGLVNRHIFQPTDELGALGVALLLGDLGGGGAIPRHSDVRTKSVKFMDALCVAVLGCNVHGGAPRLVGLVDTAFPMDDPALALIASGHILEDAWPHPNDFTNTRNGQASTLR